MIQGATISLGVPLAWKLTQGRVRPQGQAAAARQRIPPAAAAAAQAAAAAEVKAVAPVGLVSRLHEAVMEAWAQHREAVRKPHPQQSRRQIGLVAAGNIHSSHVLRPTGTHSIVSVTSSTDTTPIDTQQRSATWIVTK